MANFIAGAGWNDSTLDYGFFIQNFSFDTLTQSVSGTIEGYEQPDVYTIYADDGARTRTLELIGYDLHLETGIVHVATVYENHEMLYRIEDIDIFYYELLGAAATPDATDDQLLFDSIFGAADTISLSHDADEFSGDDGADTMEGFGGDDMLMGGLNDDWIDGGTGDDEVYGGTGQDSMIGGDGHDHIDGGAGHDEASGSDGDDTMYAGDGDDHFFGNKGADRIAMADGTDMARGGHGRDTLFGGSESDQLDGGSGKDRLHGGNHDDSLMGGGGDDLLAGGRGSDAFYFRDGDGADRILDFNVTDDLLAIEAGVFGDGSRDLQDYATSDGDSLFLDFGDADTITLDGVTDASEVSLLIV